MCSQGEVTYCRVVLTSEDVDIKLCSETCVLDYCLVKHAGNLRDAWAQMSVLVEGHNTRMAAARTAMKGQLQLDVASFSDALDALSPEIQTCDNAGGGHCFYYACMSGEVYNRADREKSMQEYRDAVYCEVTENKQRYVSNADFISQLHVMAFEDSGRTQDLLTTEEWGVFSGWCTDVLRRTSEIGIYNARQIPNEVFAAWGKCQSAGLWAGTLQHHALAVHLKKPLYVGEYSPESGGMRFMRCLPQPVAAKRQGGLQRWYV
jgi:hypothetical protein